MSDRDNRTTQFAETWNEFKTALYAPPTTATDDFNAFYWLFRLSRDFFRSLMSGRRSKQLVPYFRPVIPFLGMMLVVLCVASYFMTFRHSVVVMRWCSSCLPGGEEACACN